MHTQKHFEIVLIVDIVGQVYELFEHPNSLCLLVLTMREVSDIGTKIHL